MDDINATLDSLIPEVDQFRAITLNADTDFYDMLIRSSFTKTFDFAYWAIDQNKQAGISFWAVGTLRGIVEDVIILSAIRKLPCNDRHNLLQSWMLRDTLEGLTRQSVFFAKTERLQSVLPPPSSVEERLSRLRQKMRQIWEKHGYNPGRADRGNIRDLANSSGLSELYDFLYALTSRLVHFSPAVLLRSGWGHFEGDTLVGEFRASHFDGYYQSVVINYSLMLFAEYIQRLGPYIGLGDAFFHASTSIQEYLAKRRLPELITYEEMNATPPSTLIRVAEAVIRSGDVAL